MKRCTGRRTSARMRGRISVLNIRKGDLMLQKLLANTLAKKTTVFASVFVMTCIIMGSVLRSVEPQYISPQKSDAGQAMRYPADQTVPAEAAVQGIPIPESGKYTVTPPRTSAFLLNGESPAPQEEPVFDRGAAGERSSAKEASQSEGFVYTAEIPLSYELQRYTYTLCAEKDLEYELILALMWRESGFQVDAVGHNTNGTKDSGIMQINDVNKSWLREEHGIVDLMDPIQNIDAGTTILKIFTEKYGQHGALMAYQYGEAGMRYKYEQGVYTNDKITLLMAKRDEFSEILQNA